MTLSVVLFGSETPKKTEEALRRVSAYLSLKKYPWEVHHSKEAREGVLASSGKYVLVADATLSTPIKDVDKLIAVLEQGADVAVGSRAVREKDCDVRQGIAGRISEAVLNTFSRTGLRDARCAFKAYKREAAQKVFSQAKTGDPLGVEAVRTARRLGLRISEVPVMWSENTGRP